MVVLGEAPREDAFDETAEGEAHSQKLFVDGLLAHGCVFQRHFVLKLLSTVAQHIKGTVHLDKDCRAVPRQFALGDKAFGLKALLKVAALHLVAQVLVNLEWTRVVSLEGSDWKKGALGQFSHVFSQHASKFKTA